MSSFQLEAPRSLRKKRRSIQENITCNRRDFIHPGGLSQGPFNSDLSDPVLIESSPQNQYWSRSASIGGSSTARRKRRSQQEIKLIPMKQSQKVDVFQATQKVSEKQVSSQLFQLSARDELIMTQPPKRIQEPIRRRDTKRRQNIKQQTLKKKETSQRVPMENKSEVFFQQEDQHQFPQLIIPQNVLTLDAFDDSEEEEHPRENKLVAQKYSHRQEEESLQDSVITKGKSYYPTNLSEKKKRMKESIPVGTTIQMVLTRDKSGFNSFWPQFYLTCPGDGFKVMAAKKTSSKPVTTFILSTSASNFEQNQDHYLGKIKSNVGGTVYNIFGNGFSPKESQELSLTPRQLLATVIFQTRLLEMGVPRHFIIYVKKPQFRYYTHFKGMKMYGDEIGLDELAKQQENRDKIEIYHNRQPEYIQGEKVYRLSLQGRATVPSVKNFIVEKQANGVNLILFGKQGDNTFNLDASGPFSPFIAFATALTSFDNRLFTE